MTVTLTGDKQLNRKLKRLGDKGAKKVAAAAQKIKVTIAKGIQREAAKK